MSSATATLHARDYGLLGNEAKAAVVAGLKSVEWYHSNGGRKAVVRWVV